MDGNIFCVNLYNQQGYWEDEGKMRILRDRNIEEVNPIILRKNNKNLYKNISNYYTNNDSILKDRYINSGTESLGILKKMRNENYVPANILAESIDIDLPIQNKVYEGDKEQFPTDTSYEGCYKVLRILCRECEWLKTENK